MFRTLRMLLYGKWTPKILIVLVVKLIGFKPQTASKTPFTIPVAIENAKLKLSLAIPTDAPKVHQ